jgi:NAD(P)-dependent dehydrogenase (short-subunit alcohol dehydrogenase family)
MAKPAKVAIVTGAATGLGRAIAVRLARDDVRVVLADVSDMAPTLAEIAQAGGTCDWIFMPTSPMQTQMQALCNDALMRHQRIDILVNNAAISGSLTTTPVEEISLSEWHRILDVNVTGTFLACQAVIPQMKAQNSGAIVNMASGAAFKGLPFILHYVASKGAIISMTRALANELGAHDIRVNAVAPGYTLTDTQLANDAFRESQRAAAIAGRALKRDAFPEDIVGAVAFLSSEDARFITGQILAADGGSVYH